MIKGIWVDDGTRTSSAGIQVWIVHHTMAFGYYANDREPYVIRTGMKELMKSLIPEHGWKQIYPDSHE